MCVADTHTGEQPAHCQVSPHLVASAKAACGKQSEILTCIVLGISRLEQPGVVIPEPAAHLCVVHVIDRDLLSLIYTKPYVLV